MAGLLGSGSTPTNAPINYSGLNVGTSQWNMPVPIFRGTRRLTTNAMAFAGFYGQAVGGKGGGKGGGKSSQQETYYADVLLGLCEGVVDEIQNIWSNGSTTTTTTLSALGMTFFSGTLGQAPWSYWESKYPAMQQSYSQTAYLGAVNLALGESATIPENDFECISASMYGWTRSSTVAGWIDPSSHAQANAIDVLMSDFITELLTSVQFGAFMQPGDLGPMTQFAAYTRAQGLFFSPLLNSQEKVTDILNRFAQITNSWIFWSGTQMEFYPLADATISGNGVTFVPDNDVAYTLTLDDLIADKGSPPVKVTRKDPADCYNRTSLNICDRTLGYIDNPIPWFDDQLIDQFGLRDNTSVSADEICDPIVGGIVAQLIGKRAAYIRNTYQFKTNWNFILCLPGTVLEIPLNYTGLLVRVRVTEVGEDEKGILSFTAEEFPGTVGTYIPPQASAAITTSTTPNLYAAPPSVNTPAIFEPPASFTGGTPKVVIAASATGNWGGCQVSISFDASTYVAIGNITAPAPQGVLTATLAAFSGVNPDTTDTLAVDLTQSATTPQPVTTDDAANLRTLSLVAPQPVVSGGVAIVPTNGELLAFGEVTTTGTFTATLTYLERGQYGTAARSHAIGEQFTVIDVLGSSGTTVSFDLPSQYIGQTIYLKLASTNLFGNSTEDLSTCIEYQYTPTGAGYGTVTGGLPAVPTGFGVVPGAAQAGSRWNANATGDNVLTYQLLRAPGLGADISTAVPIWQGYAFDYVDTTTGASEDFTYWVQARNAVGFSGPSAPQSVTTDASGSGTLVFNQAPTGLINGTNKTFVLPSTPIDGSILLTLDGSVQTPGADYTLAVATITMAVAPTSGPLLATYLA